MRLLDRYIVTAVFSGTGLVLGLLIALSSFLIMVGQFDDIGVGRYQLVDAMLFVLAKMPKQAYEMFPIATLLGSLLGLGTLATHSELIVMRAAGVTTWRMAGSVAMAGTALALLAAALGEFIVPPSEQYAVSSKAMRMYSRLAYSRQGAWVRDGDLFINIGRLDDRTSIGQVTLYSFDEQGRLESAARADVAEFDGERWQLGSYRESRLHPDGSVEVMRQPSQPWASQLDPELLDLFSTDTDALGGAGLVSYIAYLEANNLDAGVFLLELWRRAAALPAVLFMAVLALPFNFGALRSAGTGQRMFVGVLLGAGFFLADRTFANTGQVYGLDPLLTAWLPTLILGSITLLLVRRVG